MITLRLREAVILGLCFLLGLTVWIVTLVRIDTVISNQHKIIKNQSCVVRAAYADEDTPYCKTLRDKKPQ